MKPHRLAALALSAVLLPVGPAAGQTFAAERKVIPAAAGPARLEVDAALLSAARPLRYTGTRYAGGLEDLRLYTTDGVEVPHLVVAPPTDEPSWKSGAKITPIQPTKRESGFEADLGAVLEVDGIRLEGLPVPMMKRFRLEGSGDRVRWNLLVREGTLFDLPEERLTRLETSFAPGAYRYLRVRWDDATSARVGVPRDASARLSGHPAAALPLLVDTRSRRRESEPGRSRYRVRLPGTQLPVRALHVVVDGGHVLRDAAVTEARLSGAEVTPVTIGSTTLKRAERGDLLADDMRIPIERPAGPDLELVIDDGDNPPLAIKAIRAEMLPLPSIYFEAPSAAELVARYGNAQLPAPRYDLEAMREFITGDVAAAAWGEPAERAEAAPPAPGEGMPIVGAPLAAEKFAYSREVGPGAPGLSTLLLDASALAHSRDLEDVRIVNDENEQLPYLVERRAEPLVLPLQLQLRKPAGTDRVSRYEIRLPWETIPAGTLVLTTAARVFDRTVTFSRPADPKLNRDRQQIATLTWTHADPDLPAQQLSLPMDPRSLATIEIAIDEGDNTPLPLASAKLLLPQYGLRFFRPEGKVRLLYGDATASAPKYDLALLGARLFGLPAAEVRALAEDPAAPTAAELQPKLFWGAVIVAVAVLLLLLIRMFRPAAEERGAGAV